MRPSLTNLLDHSTGIDLGDGRLPSRDFPAVERPEIRTGRGAGGCHGIPAWVDVATEPREIIRRSCSASAALDLQREPIDITAERTDDEGNALAHEAVASAQYFATTVPGVKR